MRKGWGHCNCAHAITHQSRKCYPKTSRFAATRKRFFDWNSAALKIWNTGNSGRPSRLSTPHTVPYVRSRLRKTTPLVAGSSGGVPTQCRAATPTTTSPSTHRSLGWPAPRQRQPSPPPGIPPADRPAAVPPAARQRGRPPPPVGRPGPGGRRGEPAPHNWAPPPTQKPGAIARSTHKCIFIPGSGPDPLPPPGRWGSTPSSNSSTLLITNLAPCELNERQGEMKMAVRFYTQTFVLVHLVCTKKRQCVANTPSHRN